MPHFAQLLNMIFTYFSRWCERYILQGTYVHAFIHVSGPSLFCHLLIFPLPLSCLIFCMFPTSPSTLPNHTVADRAPNLTALTSVITDCRGMVKTLVSGMKTIVWGAGSCKLPGNCE